MTEADNQRCDIAVSVLLTSVSAKVPMVLALRAALSKLSLDGKLFGADCNPDCIAAHFVDELWMVPADEQLHVEEVVDWCRSNGVGVIVPSRDAELPFWARHREQLKDIDISVMVSDTHSVATCLDKLAFYRHCDMHGFPAIYTSLHVDDINDDALVVKERYGAGADDAGINLDHAQARDKARSMTAPVFQPCVVGDEISADLYVSAKGAVKGVILRRRNLVVNGESQVTTSFRDETLEILCMVMAGSLGLRGHVMFQIIIDQNNRPHVVECNCRFGGASTLSIECGLDSFYWFLLESTGDDLSSINVELTQKPLRQIRYAANEVFSA